MPARSQSTLLRRRPDKSAPALLSSSASLRAILDSIGANVFVADLDLQLVYANRFALETGGKIEPSLRSAFGVGVADLLFGSIHRFHKDPARIERILRDPRSFPHVATFEFGAVRLATTINAIQDDSDEILGYCVVWGDVSEQQRITETTRAVAAELTDASGQLNELAAALGEQAGSSAERAGTAACAAEQMGSAIQEISSNTAVAATVANDAVIAAGSASASIIKLNESSNEIGGVVKMITAIAAQTNLLALNATIESARAGDAGKGFAVVANEVKELAKETAAATERITRMIGDLQEDSAGATTSIDSITALIGRISDGQASIAGAVEEQSATTTEIGRNVSDVARTAETTTSQVQSLASAASLVAGKAEELRRLVGESG